MPNNDVAIYVASIIFALTYAGLAFGKIPGVRMDRAGIALVGATLMLVSGMISVQEATRQDSIDYKTLALLFGMMVVVGILHLSGFFETVAKLAPEANSHAAGAAGDDCFSIWHSFRLPHQRHRLSDADAARGAIWPGGCDSIRSLI